MSARLHPSARNNYQAEKFVAPAIKNEKRQPTKAIRYRADGGNHDNLTVALVEIETNSLS